MRLAQGQLRQAVVAELEHAEVLLSTIIGKHARLAESPEQVATVAREIRWFSEVGVLRGRDTGVFLPGAAPAVENLSDQQVVDVFALWPRKEIFGVKLIFPVVDSILAGKTAEFRADEIMRLGTIKWQAHLLEQDADWTRQFLIRSFTITDETNSQGAVPWFITNERTHGIRRAAQGVASASRRAYSS